MESNVTNALPLPAAQNWLQGLPGVEEGKAGVGNGLTTGSVALEVEADAGRKECRGNSVEGGGEENGVKKSRLRGGGGGREGGDELIRKLKNRLDRAACMCKATAADLGALAHTPSLIPLCADPRTPIPHCSINSGTCTFGREWEPRHSDAWHACDNAVHACDNAVHACDNAVQRM